MSVSGYLLNAGDLASGRFLFKLNKISRNFSNLQLSLITNTYITNKIFIYFCPTYLLSFRFLYACLQCNVFVVPPEVRSSAVPLCYKMTLSGQ